MGRFAQAFALADEAMQLMEAKGDVYCMPELLRVKGGLLLSMGRWLELSRRQGARAWELRTATDLAALWAMHSRSADALALLQPVFEQFGEGLDTADLKAAERLLATLS